MSAREMIQLTEFLPCKREDLSPDLMKNTHNPSAGGDERQRQKDPRSLLPSELLSSGFSERYGLKGNRRWRDRKKLEADL